LPLKRGAVLAALHPAIPPLRRMFLLRLIKGQAACPAFFAYCAARLPTRATDGHSLCAAG
jgi:hypothetical protein